MKVAAILIATALVVSQHYLFSFQRFTLAIARKHASVPSTTTDIQLLMSPTLLGLASWLVGVCAVCIALGLGLLFHWAAGVIYLAVYVFAPAFLPLFPNKAHFASLARGALEQQHDVATLLRTQLIIDIIRAGAGRTI